MKEIENCDIDIILTDFLSEANKRSYQKMQLQNINEHFVDACKEGYLEHIHYLLTSLDLKVQADINYYYGMGLRWAAKIGRLDTVIYLLTSPYLTKHADVHLGGDAVIFSAYNNDHMDIVHYLIFDLKIPYTEKMQFISDPGLDILFKKRNLNTSLTNHLTQKSLSSTKKKI